MTDVTELSFTDAPANRKTTYSISVGDSFMGVFDRDTDEDWVAIDLTAGATYQISLAGAGDNGDADTILAVYDAAGQQVALNDDVNLAAGQYNSALSFTPDVGGVYYLSASLYTGNPLHDHTGDYVLTVTDGIPLEAPPAPVSELRGGPGDDVLRGSAGDDAIYGGAGDDRLHGLDGRDYLQGGAGADQLYGGNDADVLLGDTPPPYFVAPDHSAGSGSSGSAGSPPAGAPDTGDGTSPDAPMTNDPSAAGADASGNGGGGGDSGGSILPADEPPPTVNLTTADILDFLNGQLVAGADQLHGGAGDDWLEGGAGDDELVGGTGNDTLIGDTSLNFFLDLPALSPVNGRADDGVFATPRDNDGLAAIDTDQLLLLTIDRLLTGNDKLDGGAGNDYLEGGGGADVLLGGSGEDSLDGGVGDDRLEGGADADDLFGGAGDDLLHGDAGNDLLIGGAGADVLEGGEGDDQLMGDSLPYYLFIEPFIGEPLSAGDSGGVTEEDTTPPWVGYDPYEPWLLSDPDGGDDMLNGGAGDDFIDGGAGDDRLTGGAGSDTFAFGLNGGNDRVMDFDAAADKLDLSAFAGLASMADLTLRQHGGDLFVDLSGQGGGQVLLENVTRADLDNAHFVFSGMVGDDPMGML